MKSINVPFLPATAVIAGCVSGLMMLAILVFVAVCAFLITRKGRHLFRRTHHGAERIRPDSTEVPDEEHDGVRKRAPTHTSDEQERLLRQRIRGE